MKTTARAPFMPLTDVDDDRLEQLARQKGVGTLDKPGGDKKGADRPLPTPSEDNDPANANPTAATPRSRMKTVNLELPDYVWTELKITAVRQQTSLRHVVMAALRNAGVMIADIDLVEDGRRNR